MISRYTANAILKVFELHLSETDITYVIDGLKRVKGSKSFTETVKLIDKIREER